MQARQTILWLAADAGKKKLAFKAVANQDPTKTACMPRFAKEAVAVLKTTMRARAGEGYRFRDEELEDLAARTGLSQAQVRQWASDKHRYYATEQEMEQHLAGDGKVRLKRCENAAMQELDLRSRNV